MNARILKCLKHVLPSIANLHGIESLSLRAKQSSVECLECLGRVWPASGSNACKVWPDLGTTVLLQSATS